MHKIPKLIQTLNYTACKLIEKSMSSHIKIMQSTLVCILATKIKFNLSLTMTNIAQPGIP